MRSKPRDRNIASKPAAGPSPPYDLAAIKAANRKHRWERYGKPVAPAFLPDELDQINALREALPADVAPNAYRLSDAGVVKACFKYAVKQLLKASPAKAESRRKKAWAEYGTEGMTAKERRYLAAEARAEERAERRMNRR